LTRSSRRITAFAALALTLFLAQIGALAHGYSHLRGKTDLTGSGSAGQICTECLSITPLLSAVGSSNGVVVFHPQCAAEAAQAAVTAWTDRRPSAAFRSRAPPALV
jgi:hypothetical protein